MRNLIFIAAGLMFLATPMMAQELELGPGGVRIEPWRHDGYRGHWGNGPDCRRLRWHCLHKDELDEEGQGNCERYRRLCRY